MKSSKRQVERYVTQAAFAKLRGVSKQYVNKLVNEGAIVLKDRKVDTKQADRAIASRPRPGRVVAKPPKAKKKPSRSKPQQTAARAEERHATSATKSLTAARAEDMQYKAKIAKLDYDERIGLVVRKDQVLKAEQRKNENIRAKFRAAPREISSLYQPGMSKADLEDLLRVELNRRLEQLSRDPLGMLEASAPRPDPVAEVQTSPIVLAVPPADPRPEVTA